MSVRAYKVIEIQHNDEPTFNLWHDTFLVSLLAINFKEGLTENGGLIEVSEEEIKKALQDIALNNYQNNDFDEERDKDEQIKDTQETLQKMLKDVQEKDNMGYVTYYCY